MSTRNDVMVLHTYESRLFGAGEEIDNARERYIKKKKKRKKEDGKFILRV